MLAMTPQKRINIYIKKKSRNRGRGGTRGATANSVGTTVGPRTARRGGGGEKRQEEGESVVGPQFLCPPRPLGPAAWKLR